MIARGLGDADPQISAAAVLALGRTRSSSKVPALTTLLADSDPAVRGQVVTALGRIGDAKAAAILHALWTDTRLGRAETGMKRVPIALRVAAARALRAVEEHGWRNSR